MVFIIDNDGNVLVKILFINNGKVLTFYNIGSRFELQRVAEEADRLGVVYINWACPLTGLTCFLMSPRNSK